MIRRVLPMVVLAGFCAVAVSAFSQDAASTYKAKCAMCHGATGKGNPAMAKSMQNLDLVTGTKTMSQADVANIITKGKGKMPAFPSLSAAQAKDLAAYVKALK